MHPLALKVFDVAHFATGDRFPVFDKTSVLRAPMRFANGPTARKRNVGSTRARWKSRCSAPPKRARNSA